jgi:hypothetical protein
VRSLAFQAACRVGSALPCPKICYTATTQSLATIDGHIPPLTCLHGRLSGHTILATQLSHPATDCWMRLFPLGRYPFNRTGGASFALAMYGDATLLYRRSSTPPQTDLGTLYCPDYYVMDKAKRHLCMKLGWDYRNWTSQETLYNNVIITQPTLNRSGR